MHPFHTITLAHEHVADLISNADARRLTRQARRSRRGRGARSPAPPAEPDAVVLSFLAEPDERRPAA